MPSAKGRSRPPARSTGPPEESIADGLSSGLDAGCAPADLTLNASVENPADPYTIVGQDATQPLGLPPGRHMPKVRS